MSKPTEQEILDDLKAVREQGALVGTICAACGQRWKMGQMVEILGTGRKLGQVTHYKPEDCIEPEGEE